MLQVLSIVAFPNFFVPVNSALRKSVGIDVGYKLLHEFDELAVVRGGLKGRRRGELTVYQVLSHELPSRQPWSSCGGLRAYVLKSVLT